MLQLRPPEDVLSAVARAHSIVASAYLLPPGPLRGALEAAARRGARVVVRLEAQPQGEASDALGRSNRRTVRELRHLGADAAVEQQTHLKAVVCDGVAYLDDRNFAKRGDQIVLRDDSRRDAAALCDAIIGRPHASLRTISTNKGEALAAEARLLDRAVRAKRVDVETESFSWNGVVYRDLLRLAQRGVHCRLVVGKQPLHGDTKEARAIERLEQAGVQVRCGNFNAKTAIVDRKTAWTGSANATSSYYDAAQTEWAVRTHSRSIVSALQSQFDAHWRAAKPVSSSRVSS